MNSNSFMRVQVRVQKKYFFEFKFEFGKMIEFKFEFAALFRTEQKSFSFALKHTLKKHDE